MIAGEPLSPIAAERLARVVLETTPDAFLLLDEQRRVLGCNPAAGSSSRRSATTRRTRCCASSPTGCGGPRATPRSSPAWTRPVRGPRRRRGRRGPGRGRPRREVDLRTGRPVAAEALVRWAHPVRGVLGPAEFLPAIERSPLIRRLALAALEHATASAAAWRAEGLELTVAVNLTVLNLLDLGIAHDVARLLARHGLPPRLLTLEVTEEALMLHRTRAAGVLGGLRAMGVRIAVDDFGTGYSSLAYLQRLPLDELRIDRAFVRDVVGNRRDAAIVRAVVDLAHHLELRAVGEGVERPEQARALRAAGCDVGQGFGFGEPMPAAALRSWAAALAA